ncbi:MAG: hypothetical protein HY231_13250 [Acidobacteria bacterium]|nr:hypothetical protein [Acidobacteriota bacterium]
MVDKYRFAEEPCCGDALVKRLNKFLCSADKNFDFVSPASAINSPWPLQRMASSSSQKSEAPQPKKIHLGAQL